MPPQVVGRHHHLGTQMPSGGVHPITAALVGKVEEANIADICDQLAKDGLIDWYRSSSGPDDGSGRITERGVHVIQGITSAASSKPEYIAKLIAAVDRSSASEA